MEYSIRWHQTLSEEVVEGSTRETKSFNRHNSMVVAIQREDFHLEVLNNSRDSNNSSNSSTTITIISSRIQMSSKINIQEHPQAQVEHLTKMNGTSDLPLVSYHSQTKVTMNASMPIIINISRCGTRNSAKTKE